MVQTADVMLHYGISFYCFLYSCLKCDAICCFELVARAGSGTTHITAREFDCDVFTGEYQILDVLAQLILPL